MSIKDTINQYAALGAMMSLEWSDNVYSNKGQASQPKTLNKKQVRKKAKKNKSQKQARKQNRKR